VGWNAGGAARGEPAGDERHRGEQRGRGGVGGRVVGRDADQLRAEEPRGAERGHSADAEPDGRRAPGIAEHPADDALRGGAEGDADPDLAPAARHGVDHHGVQPHGRERQGEGGQRGEHPGADALHEGARRHPAVERRRAHQRECGIDRREGGLRGRRDGERIEAGTDAHLQEERRAGPLRPRHVHERLRLAREVVGRVAPVARHADDGHRRPGGGGVVVGARAHRLAPGEVAAHVRLVDDRHRRRGRVVARREGTPAHDGHAERGEVVVADGVEQRARLLAGARAVRGGDEGVAGGVEARAGRSRTPSPTRRPAGRARARSSAPRGRAPPSRRRARRARGR
jgi:hypothetical protein